MTQPQLIPENVDNIYADCLSRDHTDPITVEGVLHRAVFSRRLLAAHYDTIRSMLDQLPDQFKPRSHGGDDGWTFLNACTRRDGELWTGVHLTVEKLLLLGIATDQAKWLLPRDMWQYLPGGMPYVIVYPGGVQ